MKFNSITVVYRTRFYNKWDRITFSGIRAHDDLIFFAQSSMSQNKEIMVVEAEGVCLYSRLSSPKDICWEDLCDFFCCHRKQPDGGVA